MATFWPTLAPIFGGQATRNDVSNNNFGRTNVGERRQIGKWVEIKTVPQNAYPDIANAGLAQQYNDANFQQEITSEIKWRKTDENQLLPGITQLNTIQQLNQTANDYSVSKHLADSNVTETIPNKDIRATGNINNRSTNLESSTNKQIPQTQEQTIIMSSSQLSNYKPTTTTESPVTTPPTPPSPPHISALVDQPQDNIWLDTTFRDSLTQPGGRVIAVIDNVVAGQDVTGSPIGQSVTDNVMDITGSPLDPFSGFESSLNNLFGPDPFVSTTLPPKVIRKKPSFVLSNSNINTNVFSAVDLLTTDMPFVPLVGSTSGAFTGTMTTKDAYTTAYEPLRTTRAAPLVTNQPVSIPELNAKTSPADTISESKDGSTWILNIDKSQGHSRILNKKIAPSAIKSDQTVVKSTTKAIEVDLSQPNTQFGSSLESANTLSVSSLGSFETILGVNDMQDVRSGVIPINKSKVDTRYSSDNTQLQSITPRVAPSNDAPPYIEVARTLPPTHKNVPQLPFEIRNDKNVFSGAMQRDAFVAQNQPREPFVAQNKPREQFVAQNQPLEQFAAQNQPHKPFVAQNQPREQFVAQKKPLEQFVAQNKPLEPFVAQNEPRETFVAQNQPREPFVERGQQPTTIRFQTTTTQKPVESKWITEQWFPNTQSGIPSVNYGTVETTKGPGRVPTDVTALSDSGSLIPDVGKTNRNTMPVEIRIPTTKSLANIERLDPIITSENTKTIPPTIKIPITTFSNKEPIVPNFHNENNEIFSAAREIKATKFTPENNKPKTTSTPANIKDISYETSIDEKVKFSVGADMNNDFSQIDVRGRQDSLFGMTKRQAILTQNTVLNHQDMLEQLRSMLVKLTTVFKKGIDSVSLSTVMFKSKPTQISTGSTTTVKPVTSSSTLEPNHMTHHVTHHKVISDESITTSPPVITTLASDVVGNGASNVNKDFKTKPQKQPQNDELPNTKASFVISNPSLDTQEENGLWLK